MTDDYELMAELILNGEAEQDSYLEVDTQLRDYLLDGEIGRQVDPFALQNEVPARKVLSDMCHVIDTEKPTRVLHDEEAMYYLLSECLKSDELLVESQESRQSRVLATEFIRHQLAPQKIAPGQFDAAFARSPLTNAAPVRLPLADKWVSWAERIQYRSQPMWVKYCRMWAIEPRKLRPKVQDMIEKADSAGPNERHQFTKEDGVVRLGYNYSGILILFRKEVMCVIDNSTADYLRTAMTAYRNAVLAFSMIRVSGDTLRANYTLDFNRCVSWIGNAISSPQNGRYVARHMHLVYTCWQNSVAEAEAPIDCGWGERVKPLEQEVLEVYPYNLKWKQLVESIDCPERVRAEFLKLYHLLPPPDVDPLLLHNTMNDRTKSANVASKTKTVEFLNFCKAYDLCRFMSKYKKVPNYKSDSGVDLSGIGWAKKCLRGKLTLPPKEDWGKIYLYKEFEYPHTGDFHVLSAKDSTRIVSDLRKYMDRERSRDLPKAEQNELLSALFRGETLSNGMTMKDWREKVMTGKVEESDNVIGAIAGKAENTKPGKKVRETLSACDTVREYFTEVDHSIRPLAELTPGVSIRVNMVKHKKKFQAMARSTSSMATSHAFATSTDISGWSPKMDRNLFHAWQEYALSTTECENPTAQVALWNKLKIFTDRRGIKESFSCKTGNIQGWPATSDTTMHAHILIWWVYELKEKEILTKGEAAYTLCLIDDAATVVALEGTIEQAKEKAQKSRDLLKDMYADLGFEMDSVKSFFSSLKFVYLNELYVDGAQVAHGTKTLMRIDKDHTRRFATLTDNIATAYTTAASAASQGADPFVAYWMATQLTVRWALAACPSLSTLPPLQRTMVLLAPVSLCGLGCRPITSVMATGEVDHISWFTEIAYTLVDMVGAMSDKAMFSAILDQPLAEPDPVATLKSPFAVKCQGFSSPSAAIANKFTDAAVKRGLAEPFLTLSQTETSDEFRETVERILRSGCHEAALLEEVAANMPLSLIEQIMARVEKTEIVAYLLGSKGIGSLRRRVQTSDKLNLQHIVELARESKSAKHPGDSYIMSKAEGPLAAARNIRDRYYENVGWTIINHTYPCPFSLWAFSGEVDLESESARRRTTSSFFMRRLRKTAASSSVNLYDSALDKLGYRGYMTARSDAAREARIALADPVRRMVAAGLAAFRWAQANGAHYKNLLVLFLKSWCGEADERLMELPGRIMIGSAKRLSMRHTKSSHLVHCFANTQAALRVDARAVTVAQANVSNMYDVMAAITVMRCSGLLEASLRIRNKCPDFAYGFTYKPNSSAVIRYPPSFEQPLHPDTIKVGTPMSMINTPMASSVRKCCSYDGMSRVLTTYAAAGEKAARAVYDAMVEGEVISSDLLNANAEWSVEADVTKSEAATSVRAWSSSAPRRKENTAGSVIDYRVKRGVDEAVLRPVATVEQLSKAIAVKHTEDWVIKFVMKDAKFCADIAHAYRLGGFSACEDVEEWEEKSNNFIVPEGTLRDITHEVLLHSAGSVAYEQMELIFRYMGCKGFRSRGENEDLLHMAMSFAGTIQAISGRVGEFCRVYTRLNHRQASGYSEIKVEHTTEAQALLTVRKILRAQWVAAAGRRDAKSSKAAKSGVSMETVTRPNYEASYLRCASRSLSAKAKMHMPEFWASCIKQ